ncbi:MAG: hypothetical protein LBM92_04515 [Opitutaceae bacterium]|jgi:TfoX/Sxy family transcriptional regulator of competence genes|nr:hypothetical protein [Opitutaceae bacterium]
MATDPDYIEYVLENLAGLDATRKKMFGEYMIYLGGKPVLLVCDNTVFIKKHSFLEDENLEAGHPYQGAKEHYILNPEEKSTLRRIASWAEKITPLPKPRKKRLPKGR